MGDPYSPPTLADAATASAGSAPAQPPGPGFFESIGLGFKRGGVQEDWGLNQTNYEAHAYDALYSGLSARGYRVPRVFTDTWRYVSGLPDDQQGGATYPKDIAAVRAFWSALKAERARDPKFLPEYGDVADYPSLLAHIARVRNEATQRIDAQGAGGSAIGSFVGQAAHGLGDPINLTVGGRAAMGARGTSIARQILNAGVRDAATNAGIATVEEPFVRQDAASLGHDRSAGDFLETLVVAAGSGFALGTAIKGVGAGVGALAPHVADAAAAVRARWRSAGTAQDREAVSALDAMLPPEMRTPDEHAAVHVVTRAADVAESSPFVASPAGDDAHAAALGTMLDAITAHPAAPPGPLEAPAPVTRAALLGGTADPSSLRAPAREQLKARIHVAEASGGDYNAKSGATGPYQFLASTWRRYFLRRYGRAGLSDAEIAARRRDPALNEVLMNDLVADNARALHGAGQPETAGSLYLLHFAGEKGGLDVLRSAAETPIERLLSPRAIEANPFLRGKTAGWVVAWADRKMGARVGETAPVEGTGPTPSPSPEGEGLSEAPLPDVPVLMADREPRDDWLGLGETPAVRPEQFASPEDHARGQLLFERERDARDGFTWIEHDPEPARPEAPGPLETALADEPKLARPRRPLVRNGPQHLRTILADAGGIADTEGHDLLGGRNLQRFVPGAGNWIRRRGGMSIDQAGEYLWERGWFGPPDTTARPTTATVLDLIERAADEKVWHPNDAAPMIEAEARARAPGQEEAWHALADQIDAEWGLADFVDRNDAELRDLTMQLHADGEDATVAHLNAVQRLAEARLREAAHETGTIDHDIPGFDDERFAKGGPDRAAGESGGRPGGEPGDTGEAGDVFAPGEGPPEARAGPLDLAIDEAEAHRLVDAGDFSDPAGREAEAQADSLEHDLRMELLDKFAPNDPDVLEFQVVAGRRVRRVGNIEAARREIMRAVMDRPDFNSLYPKILRYEGGAARFGDVEVRHGNYLDLPPIDAPEAFRVSEDGDPRNLQDLLDEVDEEKRAADEIRACMAPPKGPEA